MKIFNLTDVETPALKQRGLVNQAFAVGVAMLAPGAEGEIDDETFTRVQPELQKLVELGALACDTLPDTYRSAKMSAEKPPTPLLSGGSDEPASSPVKSGKAK